MEESFWQERWQKNEIGFHMDKIHPWLSRHWPALSENTLASKRIFVPLCGKSLDIGYFLTLGHTVLACELSEDAVKQLFMELGLSPRISSWGVGLCYEAERLKVYVGDYFNLSPEALGSADYIYDRAALIALPINMRKHYTAQLIRLCPKALQLLICLDYAQDNMNGPPFSVDEQEVKQHYQSRYDINMVMKKDIIEDEPRFKQRGLKHLKETLYWLTPKAQ